MRFPLVAALLLAAGPCAAEGARGPVDWKSLEVPLADEQIEGLRKLGFRLEGDGRVLDLELKVLDQAGLDEALRLLNAGDRRLRLERLRALLAAQPQDRPLSAEARAQARQLALGRLYSAFDDAQATAGRLRRLTELDLGAVAAAFDGAAARGAAAVAAPDAPPAGRPYFPYLTMDEQRSGENLRAAAAAELSRLERGRLILSRLNGPDGKPDLPPILVEASGTPARYDANRRALVLDRELVLAELMNGVLPVDIAARRRSLSRPNALAQALAADPAAAARVLARQDVLVAHELTHAWQDRRDPLFRQMVRGTLPNALVLEYEEEAYVEKNLYLHEKLKAAPGAYVDDAEMLDYQTMILDYDRWKVALFQRYQNTDGAGAADLDQLRELQRHRLAEAQRAPVSTTAEQRKKALTLRRLARGSTALQQVQSEHSDRITALKAGRLAADVSEYDVVMARHELQLALQARNDIEKGVHLQRAERHARASGDAGLLRQIQSMMERNP